MGARELSCLKPWAHCDRQFAGVTLQTGSILPPVARLPAGCGGWSGPPPGTWASLPSQDTLPWGFEFRGEAPCGVPSCRHRGLHQRKVGSQREGRGDGRSRVDPGRISGPPGRNQTCPPAGVSACGSESLLRNPAWLQLSSSPLLPCCRLLQVAPPPRHLLWGQRPKSCHLPSPSLLAPQPRWHHPRWKLGTLAVL